MNMKRFAILFSILMLIALPVIALADSGVNATVRVGRENITVGDVIPLQVTVTHPQGWRVVFPKLENKWGDLEVRAQNAPVITRNADGTETTTQVIEATNFRPGSVTTPEMSLTIADAQGQVQTVLTEPVSLKVKSVLTQDDQDLRDIKPQAELWQLSNSPLPFAGSLAVAFLVVGTLGVMTWKHRPIPDKRTPRERALDDLKEIGVAHLTDQMDVKLYCVRVSDILRDYLAKGCNIPTFDLTTGELAQEMRTLQIPAEIQSQVVRVLRVCDDVKFANDVSNADAIETLANAARQIVATYPPVPVANKSKKSGEVKA